MRCCARRARASSTTTRWRHSRRIDAGSGRCGRSDMNVGVLDAGVVISWILRRPRSYRAIERLFDACRAQDVALHISVVNLAEVIKHTAKALRAGGADPVALLASW